MSRTTVHQHNIRLKRSLYVTENATHIHIPIVSPTATKSIKKLFEFWAGLMSAQFPLFVAVWRKWQTRWTWVPVGRSFLSIMPHAGSTPATATIFIYRRYSSISININLCRELNQADFDFFVGSRYMRRFPSAPLIAACTRLP